MVYCNYLRRVSCKLIAIPFQYNYHTAQLLIFPQVLLKTLSNKQTPKENSRFQILKAVCNSVEIYVR